MKPILRIVALALVAAAGLAHAKEVELLNVSYDPTRELYESYNAAFAAHWEAKTGDELKVRQSHGGSGKQARSVVDGLEADVVTLALAADIDAIAGKNLLPADWQAQRPHNSSPYTSTIVLLVRKGNPKGIHDWADIVKPGITVVTPNPKTSGGARWNYLAAWAYGRKAAGTEQGARDFVTRVYRNAPILDTGARGATTTFVQRGIGDVLLAWENEAFLAVNEFGQGSFEIVVPSVSILAEPPVTTVNQFARKHGTLELAAAYLDYLYSPEGQRIVARNYYRPVSPEHADPADIARFPAIEMKQIDRDFGGWTKVQQEHFAEGGIFDQIYTQR
jgi:sulfate transport system substrate-binding protein